MNDLQPLVDDNNRAVRDMQDISRPLCAWFDSELLDVHRHLPVRRDGGLLMGCAVWGGAYVRRMCLYSLPTLGTDRNLQALSGRSTMVFYSQGVDRPTIWQATRWMRRMGIHTVFRELPDAVLEVAASGKDNHYGVVASVQNILAHMAGHAGMGLHMYMPDQIYSEGYFERLLALGAKHPAIIQQSVSMDEATAADALDQRRQPDSMCIAIPARQLGGLAVEHMHARSRMHVMNWGGSIPDKLPDSRQIMWIGKDALHIADCAQLLSWISPELCADAPIAFMSTLDMLAPEYVPPGLWYMPEPEDDMVFAELTDAKRVGPPAFVSAKRFIYRCWSQVAFTDDYHEYMRRRCRVPIPEQADYIEDAEIERQHQWVLAVLDKNKSVAMATYFDSQHPSRWAA